MYIAIQEQEKIVINPVKKAQIKDQVEVLIFNKAFIVVLVKDFNYNNIFSITNIIELLKSIIINNHAIKLEHNK